MIEKKEFRDTMKLITQLRISAEEEQKGIMKIIDKIQSLESELNLRRVTKSQVEDILFKKNDELFQLVYNQLPNGEDNE